MRVPEKLVFLSGAMISLLAGPALGAQIFGPQTFLRETGPPTVEAAGFVAMAGRANLRVDVDDATLRGGAHVVIALNGQAVVRPHDLRHDTRHVQVPVRLLQGDNELVVRLGGRPGGRVVVAIDQAAPPVVERFIPVASGGIVVHPAGAVLRIAAGALSQDATVRLVAQGHAGLDAATALLAVSQAFTVDFGGAEVVGDLELALRAPLAIEIAGARADPPLAAARAIGADGMLLRVPAPAPDLGHRLLPVVEVGEGWFAHPLGGLLVPAEPSLRFDLAIAPSAPLWDEPIVLDVPFYHQAALPWCGFTSLAMFTSFHDTPMGLLANWEMAGATGADEADGTTLLETLETVGFARADITKLRWDADLIPSDPFTQYVKLWTHGFQLQQAFGDEVHVTLPSGEVIVVVPSISPAPRPVQLGSDVLVHAFVGVGSSAEAVWIHDSNGGIAEEVPWEAFRDTVMDPGAAAEVTSIVIDFPPRPAEARRGSIVLIDGYSLAVKDPRLPIDDGWSYWQWDGDPWSLGYVWDDLSGAFAQDETLGTVFPLDAATGALPGFLMYRLDVANPTPVDRAYELTIALEDPHGVELTSATTEGVVMATSRTWESTFAFGFLLLDGVREIGTHTVRTRLVTEGVLQDEKSVTFTVVESDQPAVTALAVPTLGRAPLTVHFDVVVAGGHPPYTYFWETGDGLAYSVQPSPTYTYEVPGRFVATVEVTDAHGAVALGEVPVAVYHAEQPMVTLKPDPVAFGEVPLDFTAERNVYIGNDGSFDLQVDDITLLGSDRFEVLAPALPFVVGPFESRTVVVAFTPLAEGDQAGVLRVSSDDPWRPEVTVEVRGTGVAEAGAVLRVSPSTVQLDPRVPESAFTISNDGVPGT